MRDLIPVRSIFGAGYRILIALTVLSLAACGGGGGSSSGSGTTNSYTIGGNVTGLSASGLVLQDNGGDNLTVSSGAGTFTFSSKVSSGGAYAVTVLTQPTGETCTVSNGTGTATANVTTVGVACTVDTYTIGGNVTGLNASGLVLQDNGGDNLTVSSGAKTFTFSTQLSSGTAYKVTVYTQPTDENCTVSSGTGTATANVTSVGVACVDTYSIAGTITGLSNAGLKLQDYSGGEILPVPAGATKYQFTQRVPYGTTVQVKATAQPTLETCTAAGSNFSGPITSNITSDTFSCSTLTATVSTLASGSSFNGPAGVAVDSSGNIYVANTAGSDILLVTPTGTVSVLAGTPNTPGFADGNAATAEFNTPSGVAVDSAGNIYVAGFYGQRIRKIVCTSLKAANCTVSTLAGTGSAGFADGNGASAKFDDPSGVAVDSAGNIYVADSLNNRIRLIVCTGSTASTCTVSTLAGTGSQGYGNGSGASATFWGPAGITVDSAGNIYVADDRNNEIRKIVCTSLTAANCTVSLLAGSDTGALGNANGTGSSASFYGPNAVAADSAGNVFVADSLNNEIRLVAPTGLVSTVAGTGPTNTATLNGPSGVAVNASGDVFVGDLGNNDIPEIKP